MAGKSHSIRQLPVNSRAAKAKQTAPTWLMPPSDLDDEQRELWRELCVLIEAQTGAEPIDATLIATVCRTAREERTAVEFANAAQAAGDFAGWKDATSAAHAARRSHSAALGALKITPSQRSGRIATLAKAQRVGETDSDWKGIL